MSIEYLDPTYEDRPSRFVPAGRLATLEGATVGLVSNGKEGTKRFFESLASELVQRHGVADVVLATKTNYSAPAGPAILEQARSWDAVFAGVGD